MLELARNQAIVGIDRIILPARVRRFVARLLQGELTVPQPFRIDALAIRNRLQRGIDR
jgi:hypothetical protein